MQRTTIMLPSELKARSQALARRLGISFGELTRESLEACLRGYEGEVREDTLFDLDVFRGPAESDLSERHDDHLYGSDVGT
jgi:predicted DNA-binding protein